MRQNRYKSIKDSINSRICLKKADEIYNTISKNNPYNIGNAIKYVNLGINCGEKGQYIEAIKYHNKALNIFEIIYRENTKHPHIATVYYNLGFNFNKIKKYNEAIKHYDKALNIALKIKNKEIEGKCKLGIEENKAYTNLENMIKTNYTKGDNYLTIHHSKLNIETKYIYSYFIKMLQLSISDINTVNNSYRITLNSVSKGILENILVEYNSTQDHEAISTSTNNNNLDDNNSDSLAVAGDTNSTAIDSDTLT